MDLEPNEATFAYSVCPPLVGTGAPASIPEFGVVVLQGRSIVLPVEIFRARLAELFSRVSVLSNRFGLILPESEFTPAGRNAIYGMSQSHDGKLAVTWSGSVLLP